MEGTYKTNKRYRDLRDAFLLENEGFRTTVYFDTVGVPTVATGVALLSRKKKAKSDKKPGRRFDRHAENIKACRNALGKNSPLEKSLESFANDALRAIDYTPEPGYSGKKKTVSSFQSTLRGKKLVQLLGPLNRKWESSHSPTISAGDANSISIEVIDQHEEKLERFLKNKGIDSKKLTEEQRIVLVDAVYHGRWSKGGVAAAKAMTARKSIEEICQCLYDPKFPSRTSKASLLLKKRWHPSKSSKNIPPSRSVQEPGISPEQLSILREYLLSEALTQQAGMSVYEQIVLRYMGAGCDFPLKHLCDPYSEIVRRYGD